MSAPDFGYDFISDNDFYRENYTDICRFHKGKTIVIKDKEIVHVSRTFKEALDWASSLYIYGKCTIKEVTGNVEELQPIIMPSRYFTN